MSGAWHRCARNARSCRRCGSSRAARRRGDARRSPPGSAYANAGSHLPLHPRGVRLSRPVAPHARPLPGHRRRAAVVQDRKPGAVPEGRSGGGGAGSASALDLRRRTLEAGVTPDVCGFSAQPWSSSVAEFDPFFRERSTGLVNDVGSEEISEGCAAIGRQRSLARPSGASSIGSTRGRVPSSQRAMPGKPHRRAKPSWPGGGGGGGLTKTMALRPAVGPAPVPLQAPGAGT